MEINVEPSFKDTATALHPESETDSLLLCPACDKPFFFRKKLVLGGIRPVALRGTQTTTPLPTDLSERQREIVAEIVRDGRVYAATSAIRRLIHQDQPAYEDLYRSKIFQCPWCRAAVQVLAQMVVVGAISAEGAARRTDLMSDEDQKLWAEWTASGFLKNFFDAGEVDNPALGFAREKSPLSQLQAVKTWFRLAVFKPLPRHRVAQFIAEYNTLNIACYSAQAVVAILADGYIKCLVPKSTVWSNWGKEKLGLPNNPKEAGAGKTEMHKTPALDQWIKTRWGYTLGRGMFFGALQQESVGAFGRATRSQRRTESGLPVATDDETEAADVNL